MECIVLAGGLGTRLQGVIGNYPKCMAEIAGKPFLYYLFKYLQSQPISRVILSLGHKHQIITDWLNTYTWNFAIDTVSESEPLGTGGGLRLALSEAKEKNVIALNGDTYFPIDLKKFISFHTEVKAYTSLALKPMKDFDRYGVVLLNEQYRIIGFEEKKYRNDGLINGGIYCLNKMAFLQLTENLQKFSFEKDYLETHFPTNPFYGYITHDYFIDIGIPQDYHKAQQELAYFCNQ